MARVLEFEFVIKPKEKCYGLTNYGNSCFLNSVLQALYSCQPFRKKVLESPRNMVKANQNILNTLSYLFQTMLEKTNRRDYLSPREFIKQLNLQTQQFQDLVEEQHDAQEFLIYILNHISLMLKNNKPPNEKSKDTWVQDLFQGILVNETKCLSCQTISKKEEAFLDLSVDIEPHCSITHCLRGFSKTEKLDKETQYDCSICNGKSDAEKCMRIKKLPGILVLHLKRFKFVDNEHKKLSYRVLFPFDLRLINTASDCINPDCKYKLFAIIVHCGNKSNSGHYYTVVRRNNQWIKFDDTFTSVMNDDEMSLFYGSTPGTYNKYEDTGYILFYQAKNQFDGEREQVHTENEDGGYAEDEEKENSNSGSNDEKESDCSEKEDRGYVEEESNNIEEETADNAEVVVMDFSESNH